MTDTNVIKLAQPGTFTDLLTEILRNGARTLLTQAVETEVADFLGRYADLEDRDGPPARRAPRASARARDHDRHWAGGRAPAPGARPRGRRGRADLRSARAFCHLTRGARRASKC